MNQPTRIRWAQCPGQLRWEARYKTFTLVVERAPYWYEEYTWHASDASRIIVDSNSDHPRRYRFLSAAKRQAAMTVRQFCREEHPNG